MFFEWVIFIFSVSMCTTATPARLYANKEQKHPNEKLPEPQQLIIYGDQLPAKQNLPQAPGTRAARQLREKPLIVLPFSARLLQNPRLLLFASGLSCRPAYFGENQRPAACFLGQSGGQVLLGVTADALWWRDRISRADPNRQMQNPHVSPGAEPTDLSSSNDKQPGNDNGSRPRRRSRCVRRGLRNQRAQPQRPIPSFFRQPHL